MFNFNLKKMSRGYGNASSAENFIRLKGLRIDTTESVKGYLNDSHIYNVKKTYLNKLISEWFDNNDLSVANNYFLIKEELPNIKKMLFGSENKLKSNMICFLESEKPIEAKVKKLSRSFNDL